MRWFLFLLLTTTNAYAGSIQPRFTTGTLESSSTSKTIIVESVVTENHRTGFSYSVTGTNIYTDSYISPDATYTDNKIFNGVSFQWVTPDLETKPQWKIKEEGEAFSLTENFLAPGLDAISTVNRTITTETQQNSLSIFSQ